jgi:hypothetical protein
MSLAGVDDGVGARIWCSLGHAPLGERLAGARGRVSTVVASAVDAEPLCATGPGVVLAAPAAVLHGLEAARAEVGASRMVALVERSADALAARAALAAAAPSLAIGEVDRVLGGRDLARLAAAAGDAAALVIDVAALAELGLGRASGSPAHPGLRAAAASEARPGVGLWISVAGAVARPQVVRHAPGTTVEMAVAHAGGVTTTAGWVAIAGGVLRGRAVDRDQALDPDWRTLVILPGESPLSRRARGDVRSGAEQLASGIDPAWRGAGASAEAEAALPVALVALRLGVPVDDLGW